MSRPMIALLLAVIVINSGGRSAADQIRSVPEAALLSAPKSFVGQKIRLDRIYCVDPGKAGFVCLKEVDGQYLMVEGLVMGASTPQSIAELLIGGCKGTANLGAERCKMAVEFEVTAAIREMIETDSGSVQRVTLATGVLEFYPTRRAKR